MALVISSLSCGYGNTEVINGLSFDVDAGCGRVLTILGPNGAGKTTLLKVILGFLRPTLGSVEVDGAATFSLPRRELARLLAYVPQSQAVPFNYPVEDFILMGRAPHLGLLQQPGAEDREVARRIMHQLGIEQLAAKTCAGISVGELQLAYIARALTQQPRYLVLDEPTANLDYGNQMRVLERILNLAHDGIGIIMTTHNPEQAFILESQVVLLQGGGRYFFGNCNDILTEARLRETYGIDVLIRPLAYEGHELTTCRALPNQGLPKNEARTNLSSL